MDACQGGCEDLDNTAGEIAVLSCCLLISENLFLHVWLVSSELVTCWAWSSGVGRYGKICRDPGQPRSKETLGEWCSFGVLRTGPRTNTPSYTPGFHHLFFTLLGREKVPKEKNSGPGQMLFYISWNENVRCSRNSQDSLGSKGQN